ncbi:MAG: hypothetical protein M3H12_18830, partial [Chromatiales bacterium]
GMLRAAYAYCGLPAFVSLSMAGSVGVIPMALGAAVGTTRIEGGAVFGSEDVAVHADSCFTSDLHGSGLLKR